MPLNNLHDVFVDLIKDLYHAEKQLTKALPKVVKGAHDDALQRAFEEHLEVTRGHVERLERVFAELDMEPRAKVCHAMKGLIEEGSEVLEEERSSPAASDAALIAAAQKIEHYEISSYGTARAFAETLGLGKVVTLLGQTLDEEREADEALTALAERRINEAAREHAESTAAKNAKRTAKPQAVGARRGR